MDIKRINELLAKVRTDSLEEFGRKQAGIITVEQDLGEYGRVVHEIDRATGEGNSSYYPNHPLERIFVKIKLDTEAE